MIRHTSTSFSRNSSASKGFITISSSGSQDTGTGTAEDQSDPGSSPSGSSKAQESNAMVASPRTSSQYDQVAMSPSIGPSLGPSLGPSDGLRRVALRSKSRVSRAQVVLVVGPPG